MKLHFLQHVPFEDLGIIATWAEEKNIPVSRTAFYLDEKLLKMDSFDLLVVMGGPMGVYDEDKYSWLSHEKEFIRESIERKKSILGVCLGAQLIASALGAEVYRNMHKEIGWFQVIKDKTSGTTVENIFPDKYMAFHWHGDTFDIPEGAIPIGASDACKNQGFIYGENVMALQYHLETTLLGIENLIKNCGDELVSGPYTQQAVKLRQGIENIRESNRLMYKVLDYFISRLS
jgi:GMP synthase-like glutamine amidotransferase